MTLIIAWVGFLAAALCAAGPWISGASRRGRFARVLLPRLRRAMPRHLLALAGVRVRRRGPLPPAPCLVVANHVSWADALVFSSLAAPVFVALSRRWPVISFAMRALGTIFVGRNDIRSLPAANAALARANAEGSRTMVFPEGTTSWGFSLGPFQPPLFQSAIDAGVPVYAASVHYRASPGWPPASRTVSWVDFTPFPVHVWRMLHLPRVEAIVRWGLEPLSAEDRKALCRRAQDAAAALFSPMR